MSALNFAFDTTRYPSTTLTFEVRAVGQEGATESGKQGPNRYAPKTLDANGTLSGYTISAPSTTGNDPAAPRHYYTVKTPTGEVIDSHYFVPVQTSAGVVDLNALIRSGQAVAATAEQLATLTSLIGQGGTLVPQMQQSLADSAQSRALLLSSVNVVRYTTNALRDAASPPEGTWGWAADQNNYRHRESGVWISYDPAPPPPDTGVL